MTQVLVLSPMDAEAHLLTYLYHLHLSLSSVEHVTLIKFRHAFQLTYPVWLEQLSESLKISGTICGKRMDWIQNID